MAPSTMAKTVGTRVTAASFAGMFQSRQFNRRRNNEGAELSVSAAPSGISDGLSAPETLGLAVSVTRNPPRRASVAARSSYRAMLLQPVRTRLSPVGVHGGENRAL